MANTVLQTRIQLKYDTYTNWQTNNPVLRKGELGIAKVPAETGATQGEPAVLIKVGDGTSNWKDLKYITGLAGDVYAWAKAATKPTYTANEISGLSNYISGQIKDTDTQYTIKLEGRTVKLFSKNKGDADFGETPIASVTIPETTYTLITGVTNGTVKFNGTEVAVAGLKSAAYEDASAFDGAGSAAAVLGKATDAASANTVHGAKAAAAAAQATASAAMPKKRFFKKFSKTMYVIRWSFKSINRTISRKMPFSFPPPNFHQRTIFFFRNSGRFPINFCSISLSKIKELIERMASYLPSIFIWMK